MTYKPWPPRDEKKSASRPPIPETAVAAVAAVANVTAATAATALPEERGLGAHFFPGHLIPSNEARGSSKSGDTGTQPNSDFPRLDPYAERIQTAFRQINRSDYPAGVIAWLEAANPRLYAELTQRLPEVLQQIVENRAPVERLEGILRRLVEIHSQACALFRAHLVATNNRQPENAKSTEGFL